MEECRMMTISDYINIILKKKKWTRARLVREINKYETDGEITRRQNINTILNQNYITPKFAKKLEVALGLKDNDLSRFVYEPLSKQGKIALREVKKKLGGRK
jgi:hypothetical protein